MLDEENLTPLFQVTAPPAPAGLGTFEQVRAWQYQSTQSMFDESLVQLLRKFPVSDANEFARCLAAAFEQSARDQH